jgi:hypothetical protein
MLPLIVVVVVALAVSYAVTRDWLVVVGALALPMVLVGLSYVVYEPLRLVWVVLLGAVVGFASAWVWAWYSSGLGMRVRRWHR